MNEQQVLKIKELIREYKDMKPIDRHRRITSELPFVKSTTTVKNIERGVYWADLKLEDE